MNEAREEWIGTAWVAGSGALMFLLPAWILLTAVTIQLSPELSGFDLLLAGLTDEPTSPPFVTVWLRGGLRAGMALAVVSPILGLAITGAELWRRGAASRADRRRLELEALVQDAAVLEGVELVAHTEQVDGELVLPAEQEVVLADPGRRLVASVIDGALVLLAVVPVAVALPLVDLSSPEPPPAALVAVVVSVVLVLLLAGVQLYGLAARAQTLGKRWLGLRILRSDGTRADVGQIVGLRTFAWGLLLQLPVVGWLVLPAIDFVLLVIGDRHRTLHDRLADTIVVVD